MIYRFYPGLIVFIIGQIAMHGQVSGKIFLLYHKTFLFEDRGKSNINIYFMDMFKIEFQMVPFFRIFTITHSL